MLNFQCVTFVFHQFSPRPLSIPDPLMMRLPTLENRIQLFLEQLVHPLIYAGAVMVPETCLMQKSNF